MRVTIKPTLSEASYVCIEKQGFSFRLFRVVMVYREYSAHHAIYAYSRQQRTQRDFECLACSRRKTSQAKSCFLRRNIARGKGLGHVTCLSKGKTGKKYPLGELNTDGLLRKINGRWKVLHWGVAGGIGAACDAYKKYPKALKAIFGGVLGGC